MMSVSRTLPIYDVILSENDYVEFISIVETPAIAIDFIALGEDVTETVELKLSDEKKRYFTGPVLVPGKQIIRSKPTPHFIRFSADNIEQIRNKFFKSSGSLRETNVEHSDKKVGAVIIESWIKTDEADTRAAAFSDLPAGTWFVTMHVEDQDQYQDLVSTGKKGFSIEGILSKARAQMGTERSREEEEMHLVARLFEKLLRGDEV